MICQQCDHGQRYCADQCRQIAQKNAAKRAQTKYQNSRKGRINNAQRQQRFRQRQKQKDKNVTHLGSPAPNADDLLVEKPCLRTNEQQLQELRSNYRCHFCCKHCGSRCRVGFLKKRTKYPYQSKQ
jgi:hypothetical protein